MAAPRFAVKAVPATASPELRRFLTDLQTAISDALDPRESIAARSAGDVRVKLGESVRLAPAAGVVAQVLFPAASTARADTPVYLSLETGSALLRCSDGLVNGQASLAINDVGLYVAKSDGREGWWVAGKTELPDPDSVTNAMLADMPANTLKGNPTLVAANPTDIAVTSESVVGRTSGNIGNIASAVQTALIRAAGSVFWASAAADQTLRRSGSGDLGFGTLVTNNIGANQVTYGRIQQASAGFVALVRAVTGAGDYAELALGTNTVMGRLAGNIVALTGTQLTTLLDTFTSVLKGLVPASGGGTTNFLRADGNWAAPVDTNTLGPDGDKGDITVGGTGTTLSIDANAVVTAKILDANVTYAKIVNSAGFAVIGKGTTGAGVNADIVAGTDSVLCRNGAGNLAFNSNESLMDAICGTTNNAFAYRVGGIWIQVAFATVADMEAGTNTDVPVSPANQHRHRSAAKVVAVVAIAAGVPTLNTTHSFGASSITDNGVGDLQVTFSTAFSAATYGCQVGVEEVANGNIPKCRLNTAVGNARATLTNAAGTFADPVRWIVTCWGDQ